MNLWNVRHAGSPRSVDGLTAETVLDGVREGIWEPSDEIIGPDDHDWQPLERHPVFAQAMADFEPPPPPAHPDETKLDMNPLIDVALVLLIFFMLTTTYQELRKEFQPPEPQGNSQQGIRDEQLRQVTIRVTAKLEDGQPVYRVEGEVVAEKDLESKFRQLKDSMGHDKLAMEVDPEVPWRAVIAIQDAASGANFSQIIRVIRQPSS